MSREVTSSNSRITWDPAKGDALESVLSELVDLYRTGTLREELRPTTLIDLGGAFARFYKSAFRRQDRVAWSIERFPEGFDDLVREVNERLTREGIKIVNSIQSPSLYRRIPQEARKVIETFKELVAQGLMSKDEALLIVKRDFKLELSPAQVSYHFGACAEHAASAAPEATEDKRKRALVFEVERIKNSLSLELSLDRFLKGNLFESFVGVYLALHYEELAVKRQVQLPIAYKDFEGHPHSHVFLDFLVGEEIVEAKFRNSYENICRSALAQLCAYERRTGLPGHVTVVYRHPCPLMRLAIDSNISLDAEAQALGLVELGALGRRLGQSLRYVSIEDLIAQEEQHSDLLSRLLRVVDQATEAGNTHTLKDLTSWLERIGKSGEQIAEKVEVLLARVQAGRGFTSAEEQRILGSPQELTEEERASEQLRSKIVERTLSTAREGLLRELYGELTGVSVARIGSDELSLIEGVLSSDCGRFEEAVLRVLIAKEASAIERLSKRRSAPEEWAHQNSALIAAFSTVQDRVQADLAAEAKRVHERFMMQAKPFLELASDLLPSKDLLYSEDELVAHEWRMLDSYKKSLERSRGSTPHGTAAPAPILRLTTHLREASGGLSFSPQAFGEAEKDPRVEKIKELGIRIDQELLELGRVYRKGLPSIIESIARDYNARLPTGKVRLLAFGEELSTTSAKMFDHYERLAAEAAQSPEIQEYLRFRQGLLKRASPREAFFFRETQRHFTLAAPRCLAGCLTVLGQHMNDRVKSGAELDAYEVLLELCVLFRSPHYPHLQLTGLPPIAAQLLLNCAYTQMVSIRAEECSGEVLSRLRASESPDKIALGILNSEVAAVQRSYLESKTLGALLGPGKVDFVMPTRSILKTATRDIVKIASSAQNREDFAEHLKAARDSLRHLRKGLIRTHENVFCALFSDVLSQAEQAASKAPPGAEVSVRSRGVVRLRENPQELLAKNSAAAAALYLRMGLLPQHLYLDVISRREAQSRVLAFHDYRLALDFLTAHPLTDEVDDLDDETLITVALHAAQQSDDLFASLLK